MSVVCLCCGKETAPSEREMVLWGPNVQEACGYCCCDQCKKDARIWRELREGDSPLLTKLAEHVHRMWAGWVSWMFTMWDKPHDTDGTFQKRWMRQMNTAFQDLSPKEQESDRKEVEGILNVLVENSLQPEKQVAETQRRERFCPLCGRTCQVVVGPFNIETVLCSCIPRGQVGIIPRCGNLRVSGEGLCPICDSVESVVENTGVPLFPALVGNRVEGACEKHRVTPEVEYSTCAGCEIEHLSSEITHFRAEVERLQAEMEVLVWNLAGCDTLATSETPQEFDKSRARPALQAVASLVEKYQKVLRERDRTREAYDRMSAALRRVGAENDVLKQAGGVDKALKEELDRMKKFYAIFEEMAPPDIPRQEFVEACFKLWDTRGEQANEVGVLQEENTLLGSAIDKLRLGFAEELREACAWRDAEREELSQSVAGLRVEMHAVETERDDLKQELQKVQNAVTLLQRENTQLNYMLKETYEKEENK